MKKIILALVFFYFTNGKAQNVSTFMETTSNGCYGLAIKDNFLYVVSSFSGKVHRKDLNSDDSSFETFNIGGSGYQGICKVGDYVYVSKPFNGSPGIYRFNPESSNINLESFITLPNVFGLTYKDSELYFSASNKIYKVNLSSPTPSPVQIADNILGVAGNKSTIGLKVYGDYLYLTEATGIFRINLISGNYEKELITLFSGKSFTIVNNNKIYLTGGIESTGIYEYNLQTKTYSLYTQINNFIGTYDIISFNDSLFVTTQEGDYYKVAKIDLNNLNTKNTSQIIPYVYPSLVDNFINLVGIDNIERVQVINENGQNKFVKVENTKIDVSDLSAGVYFIKIHNWVKKFIKK
jgi:hypothetical protein